MSPRLAWVTSAFARGLDDDEPLALRALTAAGARVDVVEWTDAAADWAAYDRVVLRSPWDYPERFPEFVAWLERVDSVTRLVNPLPMVRWSLDKRYLVELARAGLPVVPTTVIDPGERPELPAGEVVIKPTIGAGSRDSAWYAAGAHAAALEHVARLQSAGRAVMVQPYLRRVALDGEWPLLFFSGVYSHAAAKYVALPEASLLTAQDYAQVITAHQPGPEERVLAEDVIGFVRERFGTPAYARVDLVRDDEDRLGVLEVELVEPSLFLPQGGQRAVEWLVAALLG